MKENDFSFVAMIDPDDFVRWVFPKLFYSRIPRYEAIAEQYGYTITTDELKQVKSEILTFPEKLIFKKIIYNSGKIQNVKCQAGCR